MTRKKMEGDEAQRRQKARSARGAGKPASAEAATTGASKQRTHKPRGGRFLEKLKGIRRGKQPSVRQATPHPNPGSGRRTGEPTPARPAARTSRPAARRRRGLR